MAIKISGTTVIDNSQNITNAGIVTATSFTGDGSQLTNLPGGGGNTLEATASGTLADGSKVIVNADGTVSVVTQTETLGAGAGTPEVFESATTNDIVATFDSTNNKVVIAYSDGGNSSYGTAVVGTVSGTSITFGTPVVFHSDGSSFISVTYDSTNQKIVIAYQGQAGGTWDGRAVVGTVSGTSISFGTSVVFNSGYSAWTSVTHDSSNNKIVIAYRNDGDSTLYGTAIVGTVSGTSISFGTPVVFESARSDEISATYDSTNQKVVIAYEDLGNSYAGTAVVGTVSGTSISFGTPVVFNSATTLYPSAIFDSTNNKVVIAYMDQGNSSYGTAIVGTVSGTSISFGSSVAFNSVATYYTSATFDSTNNKVIIAYSNGGNSFYGTAVVGTVSGTSISFDSPVSVNSTGASYYIRPVYDSSNQKTVIAYRDGGNSNYGTAVVFSQTGVSPVPEVGSSVVYNSSNTAYNSAVYDSTNNKVVVAYRDNANSNYGTAIVGTVSGTSISFGSPTVFESGNTAYISAVYDSTNQKVVIAYADIGNSDSGTAVVGTVSGNSISFGSPALFQSGGIARTSVAFDSTNGKVVVAYRSQVNSDIGKAAVGTVSGTSISFGTSVTFETGITNFTSIAYDSTNNKVVIAYVDDGNNSYGKAVVGTVSGTSISFGSPVTFESATTNRTSIAYDSTNQKVVIAYVDQANSYRGTAIVGTVSGTSISFGSPTLFEGGNTDFPSIAYDSTNNKVVIAYRDSGNSQYGTVIVGTVSGTSISFGSPVVFESASTAFISAEFDSTNNKVVIAYMDSGNSSYGTAVTFSTRTISRNLTAENYIGISDGAYSDGQTATIQLTGAVDDAQSSLTPGQAYYVQNDGTLSTSADTPSVFAGTALASTKLIVRG